MLKTSLTLISLSALLLGCNKPEPVYLGPLFCDLYEVRRFSQAELDWRVANAPANIRRDLTNNEDYKAECAQ